MSDIRLTPKAERELEERWKLEKEALHIFELVVLEWKTDATSVQCFDLRIVQRAQEISARLKQLISGWE